ncbi:MAG: hypothetical protein EBU26_16520 [Verrucomicrobia bacterium]|nr:hypothetical protein [Verrucomicrobiota bacterium]
MLGTSDAHAAKRGHPWMHPLKAPLVMNRELTSIQRIALHRWNEGIQESSKPRRPIYVRIVRP